MGDGLILETTFLVDLEREERRRRAGPAHAFLEEHAPARLLITVTVAGELASGAGASERQAWSDLVSRFAILPIDLDVCWEYGRAFDYLKTNGMLIGANDLWIAATALAHERPLVTRNLEHFRRVPRLQVIDYASSGS